MPALSPIEELRPLLILLFLYMCIGSSFTYYLVAFGAGMMISKRCPTWIEDVIIDPLLASFSFVQSSLQNIRIEISPSQSESEQHKPQSQMMPLLKAKPPEEGVINNEINNS